MKHWHIVYLSFESGKTGRDYIGKHSTLCINDGYLGSYRDLSFNPDSRIILGYYKSAQAAISAEIQWQRVFQVVEDPQFANKSYQTSTGFDTTGVTQSNEFKQNLSETHSGSGNPMFGRRGKLCPATYRQWWYNPATGDETFSMVCPRGYLPGRPSLGTKEEIAKRDKNRVRCPGEKNGRSRIKKDQVPLIISMKQSKQYTVSELSRMFGVSPATLYRVTNDPNYWCNR